MSARNEWKKVQQILGTKEDGIPGPKDENALTVLKAAARVNAQWEIVPTQSPTGWHHGKASSFADPADIRAFRRCKQQGKSDQECFKVGDNGIGKWGKDTTLPIPMCALPREDWAHLANPAGTMVIVEANGQTVRCQLQDTMPARANIKNGAIVDLNLAAAQALGLEPPFLVDARWRWA